jgi:hypothetical protein
MDRYLFDLGGGLGCSRGFETAGKKSPRAAEAVRGLERDLFDLASQNELEA